MPIGFDKWPCVRSRLGRSHPVLGIPCRAQKTFRPYGSFSPFFSLSQLSSIDYFLSLHPLRQILPTSKPHSCCGCHGSSPNASWCGFLGKNCITESQATSGTPAKAGLFSATRLHSMGLPADPARPCGSIYRRHPIARPSVSRFYIATHPLMKRKFT
jgi:hypothetical protein